MEPQNNKKRLHSDHEEPSKLPGSKRTKHEMQGRTPDMLSQTGSFHRAEIWNNSDTWDQTRALTQPNTPVRPYLSPYPGSLDSRGFLTTQGKATNSPSSIICVNPTKLDLPEGDDSSSESSDSSSNSDFSLSKSRKTANNNASPSSPRTVSDYKSDSESASESGFESDSTSDDGSTSSRSPSPPSAFHCSAAPMPDSSALQSRLSSFLPAIQAANETLERERVEGRLAPRNIENVDEDDEQYIEMNLGLGVLEEKRPRNISWRKRKAENENETDSEAQTGSELDSETDLDFGSEIEDERTPTKIANEKQEEANETNRGNPDRKRQELKPTTGKSRESNHLARLMGQRRPDQQAKKPSIELLPNPPPTDTTEDISPHFPI